MKNILIVLFVAASSYTFAYNPRYSCTVKLLLHTKVYEHHDFRAESFTYLKKGHEVKVVGYIKGFYVINVDGTEAYITEANIKINKEFEDFKNRIFHRLNNKNIAGEELPENNGNKII
jgi:hypothetical protein